MTTHATPYHRLAHGTVRRWWQPVLGVLLLLVLFAVFFAVVAGGGYLLAPTAFDDPQRATDARLLGVLGVILLASAGAIPAVIAAVRLVDRRPAGSVISVAGRLRWRWLFRCTGIVASIYGVYAAVGLGIDPPRAGVDPGLVALAVGIAVALVPLQAAGESSYSVAISPRPPVHSSPARGFQRS